MYMYMCSYAYMCTSVCICACMSMYPYIMICFVLISILVYAYVHACICIPIYEYVSAHSCICIWNMKYTISTTMNTTFCEESFSSLYCGSKHNIHVCMFGKLSTWQQYDIFNYVYRQISFGRLLHYLVVFAAQCMFLNGIECRFIANIPNELFLILIHYQRNRIWPNCIVVYTRI